MPGAQKTAVHWMMAFNPGAFFLTPPDPKSGDRPPLARRSIRAASAARSWPAPSLARDLPAPSLARDLPAPSRDADAPSQANVVPRYGLRNINRLAARGDMRGAQEGDSRDEALGMTENKEAPEPRIPPLEPAHHAASCFS
jgi:hypothetical protein